MIALAAGGTQMEHVNHGASLVMPEPAANRAQSVAGATLGRWLEAVVERDRNGYTVMAGGRKLFIVLYVDGEIQSAAITRGGRADDSASALHTLLAQPAADRFAMTHPLPREIAVALSGLFRSPRDSVVLEKPAHEFRELLARLLDDQFHGSVLLRSEDEQWAVLLIERGQVLGGYGSDDRGVKGTIDDVLALLTGERLDVDLFVVTPEPGLTALLRDAQTSEVDDRRDGVIDAVESAMIEVLSRLEHRVRVVAECDEPMIVEFVEALAEMYESVAALAREQSLPGITVRLGNPLLDAHWNAATQQVDTAALISTLKLAGIDDAWLIAAEAMLLALERQTEQLLTWIGLIDERSAADLHAALDAVVVVPWELARLWRSARSAHLDARVDE